MTATEPLDTLVEEWRAIAQARSYLTWTIRRGQRGYRVWIHAIENGLIIYSSHASSDALPEAIAKAIAEHQTFIEERGHDDTSHQG